MPTISLLPTKLYVPPLRPRAVPRPRLLQRMTEGLTRPLVLISAPAGFGKSALLSAWCAQQADSVRLAWLSLDREDNELPRFLAYLAAAAGNLQAGLGQSLLAALATAQPPPARAALGLLLPELASLEQPAVIIFDDYHTITNPEVHDALAYLLANLPARVHLVISTRADPPLPLARLRVADGLVEIRAADLLFTTEEARAFLADTMGLRLPADPLLAALFERTEGWPAGLQLAALALRYAPGWQDFLTAFSGQNQHVLDYLVEEVLSHQPADVQDFLLQTALLSELSGPLCDALTGRSDSDRLLLSLYRANLFLIPLDPTHTWFRYHHLFAESLRSRLTQLQPERISALHARASRWYAAHARPENAIQHALAGADLPSVAELVQEHAQPLLQTGRVNLVMRWLEALPEVEFQSRPALMLVRTHGLLLSGQFPRAMADLEQVERTLEAAPLADAARQAVMLGQVYTLRASIQGMSADPGAAIASAQRALQLLPADDPNRATLAMSLGNAYLLQGEYDQAFQAHAEAARLGLAIGNLNVVFVSITNQAEAMSFKGQLKKGEEVLRAGLAAARQQAGERAWLAPSAGLVLTGLGELLIERGLLDEALPYLEQAADLARQSGFVVSQVSAFAGLAHYSLVRRDFDTALSWVEQALAALRGPMSEGLLGPLLTLRARIHLEQIDRPGSLEAVERWAAERQVEQTSVFDYIHEPEGLTMLRLYRFRGQPEAGLALAERMLSAAQEGGRWGRALEIRLQAALLLEEDDERTLALKMLAPAIEMGQREGYLQLFVDAGIDLAYLLMDYQKRLPAGSPQRPYLRRLLSAFPVDEIFSELKEAPADDVPSQSKPQPLPMILIRPEVQRANDLLIEPLSVRELEVLHLLGQGMTNAQIAERLVVSINTVKSHLHHIQGKLEASNRLELVHRARAAGLL